VLASDELYMQRCLALARLGEGAVAPNPLVGAVLVSRGRIIGEGWHRRWGGAHAEVNCFNSVAPEDEHLLPESTLYCNLEPCSHHGKTPPCADLVVEKRVKRLVVSNLDPNPLVAGAGIRRISSAGISVETGVLETEGRWLNRTFFVWMEQGRPFVVLKWAQSSDGFLGKKGERTAITSAPAQRLVHRWRVECGTVLVGGRTALVDNPRLDARRYFGKTPARIALMGSGSLPDDCHLLDGSTETWLFGKKMPGRPPENLRFFSMESDWPLRDLLERCKENGKSCIFVEGGGETLRRFIALGLWDEIRLLESPVRLGGGVPAPTVPDDAILREQACIGTDELRIFVRP
jgi:diaminohydroxyphosphoribosylaminopyrimidine deaminase/5-amino-6-(5-phosphoribosylamino)uracil reductase